MPRKKTAGTALATTPIARNIARVMAGSTSPIAVDAIYHVPSVRPSAPGPWRDEADKIAWTDPMSGYACIIRRSPRGQHLGGYVAVPPEHPWYGRQAGTLTGCGVHVHNGLSHSAACERHEREDVSICHVPRALGGGEFRQEVRANEAARRLQAHGDDAWWFGFECDGPADVAPNGQDRPASDRAMAGVNERVYRTEAFVYHQCVRLAAQLKAVEEGRDPAAADADPGSPPPPGHDPRVGRGF